MSGHDEDQERDEPKVIAVAVVSAQGLVKVGEPPAQVPLQHAWLARVVGEIPPDGLAVEGNGVDLDLSSMRTIGIQVSCAWCGHPASCKVHPCGVGHEDLN